MHVASILRIVALRACRGWDRKCDCDTSSVGPGYRGWTGWDYLLTFGDPSAI